jgi:hypothetical protein
VIRSNLRATAELRFRRHSRPSLVHNTLPLATPQSGAESRHDYWQFALDFLWKSGSEYQFSMSEGLFAGPKAWYLLRTRMYTGTLLEAPRSRWIVCEPLAFTYKRAGMEGLAGLYASIGLDVLEKTGLWSFAFHLSQLCERGRGKGRDMLRKLA